MAYELRFPASGAMGFTDVAEKIQIGSNLRSMSDRIGLSAPDVFPDDFYGVKYIGFNEVGKTVISAAHSFSLSFTAYGSWSISDDSAWISISPTSGSGDGPVSVTVSISLNSGAARNGLITLTRGSYSVDYEVDQLVGGDPVQLSLTWGGASSGAACAMGNPESYYIPPGTSFASAQKLFANSAGTVLATTGYYSNGSTYRYWDNDLEEFTSTGLCM